MTIHPCRTGSLMQIFLSFRKNKRLIFPWRNFLNLRILLHYRPLLHPAMPGLCMPCKMNNDLIMIIGINRLLLKQGLAVQVI